MLSTLIDGIPIDVAKIRARLFAEIEVVADLKLVDLRDDKAEKMGVPTDVAKATQHALQSRVWSALAFVQYVGLNIDAAIIAAGCSCDPAHMHFKKAFVGGIVICWREGVCLFSDHHRVASYAIPKA
jgi:hypothetical protein